MSAKYPGRLQGEWAMERLRRKKNAVVSSSSGGIEETADRVSQPKRWADSVHPKFLIGDTINLLFLSSIVAQSDFGPHLSEAEKLIFPNNSDQFKKDGIEAVVDTCFIDAFQVMQQVGHLRRQVREFAAHVRKHKNERASWREDLKTAREEKAALENVIEALKTGHEDEVHRAAAKYEALQAEFDALKEHVGNVAAETEVRSKGFCGVHYRHHHPDDPWNVDAFISDWRELDGNDEVDGIVNGLSGLSTSYVDPTYDPTIDCSFMPPYQLAGDHGDV